VFVTVLTIAELLYVLGLGTWILLEKRSPVATLAWILALVALPYVGFVVFFFLGPRRIRRKRLRHKRARGAVVLATPGTEALATSAAAAADRPRDPREAQLVMLATRAGEPQSDLCEEVTLLHDAASTYDAIELAVRSAKHHVHIAYYILVPGRAGTRLRDALVERAKAGVTVRVLVDHVGSGAITKAWLAPLLAAGAKFARFNEVTFARLRSRIDFRNHRKIVVVDGTVGFTGGINITDDYLDAGAWRDTHVRLAGDAVRWLQLTFLEDWNYATSYSPRGEEYFPLPTGRGKHRVQIVASGPDRELEPIQKMYFAAIALANERVWVTTPYFIPDDAVLTALTTAALRGVDVRVLVPKRSDSLVVTAAARSYYDALLACGVRVYEYEPTMIHAKTIVVDDLLSAVGTANMDNRSFRLNFEVTAILYGEEHARELAAHFKTDLRSSHEVKLASRKLVSPGWRVAEAGARVLSPLL
jgi:cardiolipin synthase A/B